MPTFFVILLWFYLLFVRLLMICLVQAIYVVSSFSLFCGVLSQLLLVTGVALWFRFQLSNRFYFFIIYECSTYLGEKVIIVEPHKSLYIDLPRKANFTFKLLFHLGYLNVLNQISTRILLRSHKEISFSFQVVIEMNLSRQLSVITSSSKQH